MKRMEYVENLKKIIQAKKYLDKNLYRLFPKDYESKTVDAVVEILKRRENIEIFNKKAIYLYIREITNLNTKQIASSLNRLRDKYKEFKIGWENDIS